jgi:hypothetical protein
MADESLDKIWENVEMGDQGKVNQAIKDSMFHIAPAVRQVWRIDLKVNALYAVLLFCAAVSGIVFGILNLMKDKG